MGLNLVCVVFQSECVFAVKVQLGRGRIVYSLFSRLLCRRKLSTRCLLLRPSLFVSDDRAWFFCRHMSETKTVAWIATCLSTEPIVIESASRVVLALISTCNPSLHFIGRQTCECRALWAPLTLRVACAVHVTVASSAVGVLDLLVIRSQQPVLTSQASSVFAELDVHAIVVMGLRVVLSTLCCEMFGHSGKRCI